MTRWWQPAQQVNQLMLHVLLALLPGLLGLTLAFGPGLLINLLVAVTGALVAEYICLLLRGRQATALWDLSALVTGTLIALSLPPQTYPAITITAVFIAVMLGKQAFGGLGHNPFNPAMVGYAAILVSFPAALSIWPEPGPLIQPLPLEMQLDADGVSGATPLDAYRFRGTGEAFQAVHPAADPWPIINLLFLIGGIYLLLGRMIRWQASAGMLLTLGLCALLFSEDGGFMNLGGPIFHFFHGATMIGAFFIVTDPVSSPRQRQALWLFGGGVGALLFAIRALGGYPDGLAFAVLIMNGLAPLLDRLVLLGLSDSEPG